MNKLDQKITQHFAGLVVRKDLVKTVKGKCDRSNLCIGILC